MRVATAAILSLLSLWSPALAAAECPSVTDATLGAMALPRPTGGTVSPLEERSLAFPAAVHFRSRGTVTALILKLRRDMKIELAPVRRDGQLTAMDTTVVDVAGGGKQWRGVLPLSARGTLEASEPKLVNATNILGIDPKLREHLKAGHGPVTVAGRIETEGTLRDVSITHRLADSPEPDGTVVIESTTTSEDGGIHLTTLSTMSPDGLPLHAETSGTVRKGPIDVDVAIQLTREPGAGGAEE